MKTMKRMGCLLLALAMCLALGVGAFAAAGDGYEITIENAAIGETYSAYKIFDATYNDDGGVSYTISTDSALYDSIAALTDVFTLTAAAADAVTFSVTVKYGVSDAEVIAAIEGLGIEDLVEASASETAESTTLTLDVGEPGYYYITTTTGAAVTITTAAPAATVIDKNEVGGGDFFKYIVDRSGNAVQYASAALGDKLEFHITSGVPRYEGSDPVIQYVITDTLSDSGMEIQISVSDKDITEIEGQFYAGEGLIDQFVTFTDSSGNTYTLSDVAYNYTLEFTDVIYDRETGYYVCGGFILTYDTYASAADPNGGTAYDLSSSRYPTDLSVDITYTAYVTDDANHFESNTAVLNYTVMGPGDTPNPGSNSGKTSTSHVYSWDLRIMKEDGTDYSGLGGATFTLYGTSLNDVLVRTDYEYELLTAAEMIPGETYYYLLTTGRWITTPPSSATRYLYDPINAGPYEQTASLTEIKKAGADFTVEGTTYSNGVVIFDGLKEGTYTITEITAPDGYNLLDEEITITVEFDSDTGEFSVTDTSGIAYNIDFDINNGLSITILNHAGSELPSTGGIGTTIFYVIGAVLVCGAAIVLITRRRTGRES